MKTLIGYAAKFNKLSNPLDGGELEIIEPGAFTRCLKNRDIVALIEHDETKLIGRQSAGTLRVKQDSIGLYVEIDPPHNYLGEGIYESIARGDITGMSFGFFPIKDEYKLIDGKEVRVLLEVDCFEVTITAFPAYSDSGIKVSQKESKIRNYLQRQFELE